MTWSPRARAGAAAGADAVAVLAFAAVGRASHGEDLAPVGLVHTAWPFLVGAAAGWALVLSGLLRGAGVRADPLARGTAVTVWGACVVGGAVLRASVAHEGTPVPFLLVTALTTALALVGWRVVAARVARRR